MSRVKDRPSALIVMAPLRQGHEQMVLAALAAMPTGSDSPFARVTSTHFARWLLIGGLPGANGEATEPAQAYLIFTADFDGSIEAWTSAVAGTIGADIDRVFEHCERYPGSRAEPAFLSFIDEHRIEAGFSIVAYGATVAAVRESLELRHALREFAVASQGLGARELRSAWTERFGG